MANSSIVLTQLDFDSYKDSLKTFLKSQDRFKDYDFDGSNLSVLLDVLSYNTYQNAFYLNMISNEMFLDSAKLRDSVISHAKELNYLPRSFRSSSAVLHVSMISLTILALLKTMSLRTELRQDQVLYTRANRFEYSKAAI